jgi:F0F1-type ATP synthase assembly protein I
MDALAKLVETLEKFGQVEANLAMNELQNVGIDQESEEDRAKADAKRTALSNEFVAQMLVGMPGMGQQSSPQQEQQVV